MYFRSDRNGEFNIFSYDPRTKSVRQIEVEQTPSDVMAGRDPQLEKAIEVVLQALKANPALDPKRPACPVKGKTLRGTTGR